MNKYNIFQSISGRHRERCSLWAPLSQYEWLTPLLQLYNNRSEIRRQSHLSLLDSDKLMPKWVIYSLSIIQRSNQDRRKMGEVGGKFAEGFDSHFLFKNSNLFFNWSINIWPKQPKTTTLRICSDTERKWVLWCVETCIIQASNLNIDDSYKYLTLQAGVLTNMKQIMQAVGVLSNNTDHFRNRLSMCKYKNLKKKKSLRNFQQNPFLSPIHHICLPCSSQIVVTLNMEFT